jgi:hypothetical protein
LNKLPYGDLGCYKEVLINYERCIYHKCGLHT